jgi:hypothetical protein
MALPETPTVTHSTDEQEGYFDLENFDEAMYKALGAALLPFPNPNGEAKLPGFIQQILIKGIDGNGHVDNAIQGETTGRVPIVYNQPESTINRYTLPAIRMQRTSVAADEQRRFAPGLPAYTLPALCAGEVEVNNRRGAAAYVQREQPEPTNLTYDLEVRARDEREANRMLRYIRYKLPARHVIRVTDSRGVVSIFTIIREGMSETKNVVETLNRYVGWIITYRVEGELDEHLETKSPSVVRIKTTSSPE